MQGFKNINGVDVPYIILGDPAYPLKTWLMKNYIYSDNMTKEEDSFNVHMNSARVRVEIALGRLKGRWRRLQKALDVQVSFAPFLVGAACTLHNIVEEKEGSSAYLQKWDKQLRTNAREFPEPRTIPLEDEFETDDFEDDEDAQIVRNALKTYLRKFPLKTSLKWKFK